MTPRLLVLQLSESDPPGRLGEWLAAAGAELDLLRPAEHSVPDAASGHASAVPAPASAGESASAVPDAASAGGHASAVPEALDGYHGVVCLGGSMGAYDDAEHPWLGPVRMLLARAVAERMPVLAVCLGAQLLAVATGGQVRPGHDGPELGPALVAKRDAALRDPLFALLPLAPDVVQFHYDEIHVLPPRAELLAASPRYPNQAFRVGPSAYGLQFHIETTPDQVLDWARQAAGPDADLPRSFDPERLADVHGDIAEAWHPFAERFVQLAAGELEPPTDRRRDLPLA